MYTDKNFKTKKEFKVAVAAGKKITVYNSGGIGRVPENGRVSVEGPHYPAAHTWYASVVLKDGIVVKVT
jgi:hypothetical protein